MATQASGVNAWLMLNGKPLSFQAGSENRDAQVTEYAKSWLKITRRAPERVELYIDGEELPTDRYGLWLWRPKDHAGLYELTARAPGYERQVTHVRVFPQKFTQERYERMQADLSAIALDLLLRLNSPASERAESTTRLHDASPLHDYRQVKILLEQLSLVLAEISREPYAMLHSYVEQQHLFEVERFSDEVFPLPGAVTTLPAHSPLAARLPALPLQWEVRRGIMSYDVHEHRLLKQFVRGQLVTKLSVVQDHAQREVQRREQVRSYKRSKGWPDAEDETIEIEKLQRVIADCQQMQQRCFSWCEEPFLRAVRGVANSSKATQVLLKNPAYSRFYRLYLLFQEQLKISLNTEKYVTTLALRRVHELYELWSVFQVTHMAIEELTAQGYQMVSSTLFYEIEKDYFQFDVRRDAAGIVLARQDVLVKIKYEPVYPNYRDIGNRSALVSGLGNGNPLTPDMAIEAYRGERPQSVIVFDAKYRREKGRDGRYYPLQENIDQMHRYYNMIQYMHYEPYKPRSRAQKIVSSAYILFPGNTLYRESLDEIGALPLFPNMAPQRLAEVRTALNEVLQKAHLF